MKNGKYIFLLSSSLLLYLWRGAVVLMLAYTCPFLLKAQNLVLNPSFEDTYKCPPIDACNIPSYYYLDSIVKNWMGYDINAQQLFMLHSTCLPTYSMGGVPYSSTGYSYPKSGNNYIIITPIFGLGYPDVSYIRKHYLIGHLKKKLVKDSIYCVKYYVKRIPARIINNYDNNGTLIGQCYCIWGCATKVVDACITDTIKYPITGSSYGINLRNLGYSPQIKNKKIILDTANWVEISGMFKAKGGEKYIIIGDFEPNTLYDPNLYIRVEPIGYGVFLRLDDVSLTPFYLNPPQLGKDTTLCPQQFPYPLFAPQGYDSIIWSTGAINTPSILVSNPGKYWVRCVANGCGSLSDTISIKSFSLQTFSLPSDTTFCKNHPVTLSVQNNFSSYLWNTGATTPSIIVNQSGVYSLTVTNQCQTLSGTVSVIADSIPDINISIGKDTNICVIDSFGDAMNQTILLYPNHFNLPNYYWSNGSKDSVIIIQQEGTYFLKTTFPCGSIYSNTISVTGCPPDKNSYIWIPNTFTPNNDGLNDVWTPVFKNKKIILLRIFDRWGQCVFTGTEVNQYKWDGTFKGLACEQGVYAFLIIYQNEKPANTSKATTLSGHINLIRE